MQLSLIPLYLEGNAFVLYLELSEEEQQNAEVIELQLKEAFSKGPFDAFGTLSRVTGPGNQSRFMPTTSGD